MWMHYLCSLPWTLWWVPMPFIQQAWDGKLVLSQESCVKGDCFLHHILVNEVYLPFAQLMACCELWMRRSQKFTSSVLATESTAKLERERLICRSRTTLKRAPFILISFGQCFLSQRLIEDHAAGLKEVYGRRLYPRYLAWYPLSS